MNNSQKIDKQYGYTKKHEPQYVYRYIHPNYSWLYVGRTNDLQRRIYEHDCGIYDNIDKQYNNLLLESFVVYTQLDNKAQSVTLENYLIDVYKPTLNKANKYYGKSIFDIHEITWKKYIRKTDFSSSSFTPTPTPTPTSIPIDTIDEFDVGKYIRAQRINLRYTIADLSNITGISQRTISRIETGNKNVNFETIIKLFKVLDLFDTVCNSIKNSVNFPNKFRVRKSDFFDKST